MLQKKYGKRILIAVFIFFLAQSGISERRVALVIGNGDYQDSPLKNSVNDARDMATALRGYGFTVIETINADRTDMRRAVREFGETVKDGGIGLFYYAGHGIQVDGENYLVPVGTDIHTEDEVEDECLNASAVLRKMESANNRLNIIILDACRNNPFARSFRSGTRGLARMDAPTGSILAYATAPGSVASDGPGRNGLYTSKLLKWMAEPELEIGQLFRKVRTDVLEESNGQQVPWESSSLTGNFYFVAAETAPPPAPSQENPKGKESYDEGKPAKEKPAEVPREQTVSPITSAAITTDNIAVPADGNRWDWTIFVRASDDILNQINCVEYTLHPTFPNPVRTVCALGGKDRAFALSSNGWGTFQIGVKIFLKNGQVINLTHPLKFR
jgi:hypothetical protein